MREMFNKHRTLHKTTAFFNPDAPKEIASVIKKIRGGEEEEERGESRRQWSPTRDVGISAKGQQNYKVGYSHRIKARTAMTVSVTEIARKCILRY